MSHDTVAFVLSNLAATYRTPDAPAKPMTKLAQVKAAKAAAAAAVPSSHTSEPVKVTTALPLPLPEKGSLGPAGFFKAMRNAKTRDESIFAIAAYCGYDRYGNFGTQEASARAMAQRELHPVKAAAEPSHRVTVAGFVAGMPNETAKRVLDLQGRERVACETMLDLERQSREHAERGDTANAEQAMVLAKLEGQRIAEIRTQLSHMVG